MDIPFIDIAWFYLVKLLLFVIMLYFVVKPFLYPRMPSGYEPVERLTGHM